MMTLDRQAYAISELAKVLISNGQSTDQTLAAAQRLGRSLGLQVTIAPQWGASLLQVSNSRQTLVCLISAEPIFVQMNRVTAAMKLVFESQQPRPTREELTRSIVAVSQLAPTPTWIFAMAAGAGAAAQGLLFGLDFTATILIFASGAAGGLLRRLIAAHTRNILVQPFAAALLAGVVSAAATKAHVTSALSLVALCPCMVLVPGPHLLNAALDLINGRIPIGTARLVQVILIGAAISIGLLLGLAMCGASLPIDEPGTSIPLWLDVSAASAAVVAFSVLFSMPAWMIVWPAAIGMLAHATKWFALTSFGLEPATSVFIASLIVGIIITPIAHRCHMPFAAVGFAAVVSMLPSAFLFRMISGFLQIDGIHSSVNVIGQTMANGATALLTLLALCFGLIVPKQMMDRLLHARTSRIRTRERQYSLTSEAIK